MRNCCWPTNNRVSVGGVDAGGVGGGVAADADGGAGGVASMNCCWIPMECEPIDRKVYSMAWPHHPDATAPFWFSWQRCHRFCICVGWCAVVTSHSVTALLKSITSVFVANLTFDKSIKLE